MVASSGVGFAGHIRKVGVARRTSNRLRTRNPRWSKAAITCQCYGGRFSAGEIRRCCITIPAMRYPDEPLPQDGFRGQSYDFDVQAHALSESFAAAWQTARRWLAA